MRDVEALDAARELFEGEGVLKGFLDGLDAGLEDAEALVVGLLGVLADEVDEGALFAALGGKDFDAAVEIGRASCRERVLMPV